MDAKRTGAFIAALRRDRGMTQRELAEAIAVTDKAVSRWETGKGYPDVETLAPLAEALGVTVGDLLAGERTDADDSAGAVGETSLSGADGESVDPDDAEAQAMSETADLPAAHTSAPATGTSASAAHTIASAAHTTASAARTDARAPQADEAPPVYIYGVPPHVVGELYRETVRAKKRARGTTVALVIVSCVLALIIVGSAAAYAVWWADKTFLPDRDCVMSADYSHLFYNGRVYVPIDLSHDYLIGETLVQEMSVEGEPREFRFRYSSNSVFSIEGIDGLEMVFAGDGVYCLESKYEELERYDRTATLDRYVVGSESDDPRLAALAEAVSDLSPDDAVNVPYVLTLDVVDFSLSVYLSDARHYFHDECGAIIHVFGKYYYVPPDQLTVYFKDQMFIPMPEECVSILDELAGERTR